MKTHPLSMSLALLFIALLSLGSCGGKGGSGGSSSNDDESSGDSGSGDTPPQNEEARCITSTQESNIKSLMTDVTDFSPFLGFAGAVTNYDNGTSEQDTFYGGYNFANNSSGKWTLFGQFCLTDNPSNCFEVNAQLEVKSDGCLYISDQKVTLVSATKSALHFRYTADGEKVDDTISLSSNQILQVKENITGNGYVSAWNFKSDAPTLNFELTKRNNSENNKFLSPLREFQY